jgi:hypothetical protein
MEGVASGLGPSELAFERSLGRSIDQTVAARNGWHGELRSL